MQKIIELRLDLVADASAVLRHVEPAPHTTGHSPQARCQEHSRSLVHIPLLGRTGCSQTAPSYASQSNDMPAKIGLNFPGWPGRHGLSDANLYMADVDTNSASATPSH